MVLSDSERFLQIQSMNEFLYKWLYLNLHCIRAVNSDERPQTPTAWFGGEWHSEQLALLGALLNDALNSEYYITSVADKYRYLVECYWQWKTNRRTGRRIRCSNDDERERKLVQITRTRRSGKGPRARLCCACFCLSRWYHYLSIVQLTLSVQAKVTPQMKVGVPDVMWRLVACAS
jgi:hypothetical protein